MGAFAEHMKMARAAFDRWENLFVRGGRLLRGPGDRWVLDVSGSSGSASRTFAFSIATVDNATLRVTVRGGPVMGFATNVTAADTVVSVGGTSAAPHYVYAYGTVNPLSCNIASNSTSTFPNHVQGQWRRPLFKVYVASGAIVIPAGGVYHEGVIDLRTFYGP